MTTTAEYNFEVLQTADLPLADRLYLKRKKELIEMLVEHIERDEIRKRIQQYQTTLQFHIQHDYETEDALNEILSADGYKCNVFESTTEDFEDMIFLIKTNSKEHAEKYMDLVWKYCEENRLMVSRANTI